VNDSHHWLARNARGQRLWICFVVASWIGRLLDSARIDDAAAGLMVRVMIVVIIVNDVLPDLSMSESDFIE